MRIVESTPPSKTNTSAKTAPIVGTAVVRPSEIGSSSPQSRGFAASAHRGSHVRSLHEPRTALGKPSS